MMENALIINDKIQQEEYDTLSQKITQLLNAVFCASNEAMLLLDQDGYILILNEPAESVFLCKDFDLRNQKFSQFIPEQNRLQFDALLSKFSETVSEGSTPIEKIEIAAIRHNGQSFPMELSLSISKFDQEIFFIAIIRDIAEKRRAEVEISMLAHAMMSISESLAIVDLDGHIIFTNNSFQKTFGYVREELTNFHVDELCTSESESIFSTKIIPQSIENCWDGEIVGKRKNHEQFPFFLSTSTIKDDLDKPVLIICVGRDITERKNLEGQLHQAQKMEAIGQLAGGIAHDFNNLLVVISGYSIGLLNVLDKESTEFRKVREIHKAADRAASLTRQLLAFSRKQVLQLESLNLNEIIKNLEKMLRRHIGENILLNTQLASGINQIDVDASQIETIIINLVVNSRDAMPDGGELLISTEKYFQEDTRTINHDTIMPGSYISLTICDTGVGMSPETEKHIFEPFFTTKELGKGTGLGLSTVYGIVQQCGFHIELNSNKGKGTTFRILFPVSTGEKTLSRELELPLKQKLLKSNSVAGSETILVVEDEEQVRELVCEMLETYGYNIIEAYNGRDALSKYSENRNAIQLILTDMIMPEMGGKKLIENLVNFKPGTKILFMSGYTDSAIDEKGILDPGTQFIQKPFSPTDLLQKIRIILDN